MAQQQQRQAKLFAEMLGRALDDLDMPTDIRERELILTKLLGITRDKARVLLNGHALPSEDIYLKMVDELGIEPDWLPQIHEEDDATHE